MEGYELKNIIVFLNWDAIDFINYADEIEAIDVRKMSISQKYPVSIVEFTLYVQEGVFDVFMSKLNECTLALERIMD